MGTKINMVSVSKPWLRFISPGSVILSARAAGECLKDAKINPHDLGLLINTGVYRHKNTGEPAAAAFILNKIGAYLHGKVIRDSDPVNYEGALSFDLNNGGCGWLTGIQIADGFIKTGRIRYAMVVTGDSEPFRGLSENFNFEPVSAAIILSDSLDYAGFSLFRTFSYPEYSDEFTTSTRFDHLKQKWGKGNILSVSQKETYLDLCLGCAGESLKRFLEEAGIPLNGVDLVISSQSPEGFVSGMKKYLGYAGDIPEVAKNENKELHTAGPAFALRETWDDGRFRDSKNIVFLTVGSGISVACALYRN